MAFPQNERSFIRDDGAVRVQCSEAKPMPTQKTYCEPYASIPKQAPPVKLSS